MPSVYQLKARFQELLRPLCEKLAKRGITANHVTLFALGSSIIYGFILSFNIAFFWLLLPLFLFFRMALNAIDGMLAREFDMKSRLGMALNELGDVISDSALFIPFIFFAPHTTWIIALFIYLAVINEMCGVLGFMMSGERRYDGPMGKSDRALATGTIGFLIGLGIFPSSAVGAVFLLLSGLVSWSSYNRIKSAIKDNKDV